MITFCIPSKNNLRYLKTCIKSIREKSYYSISNRIIVYVDQDNDGTEEWLINSDLMYEGDKIIVNGSDSPKGIGYAYDAMFKEATTDLVVAFHADMVLGTYGDLGLLEHYDGRKSIVCATRIEPPLHPPGPEKIVKDFGMWPEDIKWHEFDKFVTSQWDQHREDFTKGLFAPWMIDKRDHLGHDPIFKSVYEDADLFRRFALAGYNIKQSWGSYVYHLTCRGGQFADANKMEDFNKKSPEWQHNNEISLKEYIRKWGGLFKEYGPCEPKPNTKYNIGLEVTSCNSNILNVEPFFNQLKVDCDYNNYIDSEKNNTSYNLNDKFVEELTTDIILKYDLSLDTINSFYYIVNNLEDILENAESNSAYNLDPCLLIVKDKKIHNPKINLNE